MRVPITKHMPDGAIIDGTALLERTGETARLYDFRDLNGEEMSLETGARFKIMDLGFPS